MKVCKLIRLLSKDANRLFKKDGASEVVRTKVVVSEEVVLDSQITFESSGLIYVVDEEATKARLDKKNKVVVETEKQKTK
jgi:hypothetical protein